MVKNFLKWVSDLFTSPPKRGFCYWCHSDSCPHPNFEACKNHRFQCEYHPKEKGNSPSFCHRCSYGWESKNKWTKPTIYKPDPNRYDSRWCLDWICDACDKRDKNREELETKKYNNTVEAAQLVFSQKDGAFVYEGVEPVEADFPITYESLAPYVKKAIAGGLRYHYYGIDFKAIVIRDGRVYTRDEIYEHEVTWEKDDV